MFKRLIGILGIVAVAFVSLTGCNNFKTDYYRPSAFGENNQCYYMQSQAEAEMLIREGLCQPTWTPAPAPFSWQTRYAPYYESAEYRDYYVPASSRKLYAVYLNDFDRTWSKEIKLAQKDAKYVDNKGQVANGNTVPRGQFGGGVRSKGGQGIRGNNGKSVKKTADKYYKQEAKKTGQKISSGGGYKSGSTSKNSSSWSSKSSSKSSSGGGIRSSRR